MSRQGLVMPCAVLIFSNNGTKSEGTFTAHLAAMNAVNPAMSEWPGKRKSLEPGDPRSCLSHAVSASAWRPAKEHRPAGVNVLILDFRMFKDVKSSYCRMKFTSQNSDLWTDAATVVRCGGGIQREKSQKRKNQ